jgi:hypothetical protein
MSPKVSDALKASVRNAVISVVPEAEIERISVEERTIEEMERALFIDVWHVKTGTSFDASIIRRVRDAVFNSLHGVDDERYPYVRHHIPEGRRVTEAA